MFNVGFVVNTHGLKGEVKVKRITDFIERFDVGNKLYIEGEDGSYESLEIDSFRQQNEMIILHFKEYNSLEAVEWMKGKKLLIKKEQQTSLPEGEYYYHEIIGCTVFSTEEEEIGVIDHILAPGANDVWVAYDKDGKEILIPYIDDVVKEVDVEKKKVIIEVMEGLID